MADKKQQSDFDVDSFLQDENAGEIAMQTPPSPGPVQEAIAPAYEKVAQGLHIAEEHPWLSGTAALVGAKALGQIPGMSTVANRVGGAVVPGYGLIKDLGTGAVNAAKEFAGHYGARNAAFDARTYQSLANKLASLETKGITSGPAYDTIVQELDRLKSLRQAASAPIAPAAEGVATAEQGINNMVRGAQAAEGAVPGAAEAAAQGAGRFGQLAQRFAPAMNALNNVTPAMAFAMPYQMAGSEMEKIRQNPNAPQYANNPFAMQQRGEAPTMGAAGAANQRRAVAGQRYGSMLSQAEQDLLEQDRIDQEIRRAAARKALRPITPDNQG